MGRSSPPTARESAAKRVNVLHRHDPGGDKLTDAQRELAELALADDIQRQLADAPPLTTEQLARLTATLWSSQRGRT